jgi:hypothetical protein
MMRGLLGVRARLGSVALALGAGLALGGCYQEIRVDDPDGSPPPWDAGARDTGTDVDAYVPPSGKCVESAGVDLLLVIDNSNSMGEEQASLIAALPLFLGELVEPPDRNGDGLSDWLPITDLQVGVVTTDMGTGGFTVPTCARSDFGDDGLLRSTGNSGVAGCMATYPSFLGYRPGAGQTVADFSFDIGCVANAGTGGCGFEQPLEAALKALSPGVPTSELSDPPVFFRGTLGHGDRENDGFVRPDTLLAVVVITDEEDCSASDPEIFNPTSPTYGSTDLNLRCFAHSTEALHPVSRYVNGLAALRVGRPDLLTFSLIAGVPPDLARGGPLTSSDLDRILRDPRMAERVDPVMPTRLVAACSSSHGVAFPAPRLVEVARGLGPERASVGSICEESFESVAADISRLFGRRACLRYEL